MSDIKGVSNKPVSSVVENQSSTKTQATSSTAQVDYGASQQLTKEGKVAKAAESKISGEATRQALLDTFKTAAKEVEINGYASEKIERVEAKLLYSMKKPSEAQKKEIADTIRSGDKQKAIDLTLKYYGINASASSGITFNRNHRAIASYDPPTRGIILRTDAFYSKGQISPDKLAAVLYHENIHARHFSDPKEQVGSTNQGSWAEHVEVYDENISRAKAIGIQQSVIDEMELYRKSFYDGLDPENQQKVNKGEYDDVK